jgi:serine/threonine-protein kinase
MTKSKSMLFEVGQVLDDKWVVIEFIGKGAMGEVYRAHQLNLKRDVAIKVRSEDFIEDIDEDPDQLNLAYKRLQREVHAMAKVRHPNILTIYDFGTVMAGADNKNAIDYIVMEYIPGNNLRFTMSDDGIEDEQDMYHAWIETYFLPILDGVEVMHSHNIIHRDLKPENIFIDEHVPKIADFGLARSPSMEAITSSVTMLGTLAYMAPEQCTDFRKSGFPADIYSLGKILYEAAVGKLDQKTLPLRAVTFKNPETPFLREMARVIEKATAEDKDDRYQNIIELRSSIQAALSLLHPSLNGQSKDSPSEVSAAPGQRRLGFMAWSAISLGTISILAMIMWQIIGAPGFKKTENRARIAGIQDDLMLQKLPQPQNTGSMAKSMQPTFTGQHSLVIGGQLLLPSTLESVSGESAPVNDFFMDNFLVTNQQYVDFLNENLSRITLVNGVVKGDGANWYLLGEIYEGFEPIVYRNNEFHVSNSGYESSPVLRVTGYGATAFASFYGRRIPSELEWLYAVTVNSDLDSVQGNYPSSSDPPRRQEWGNNGGSWDNWGQQEGNWDNRGWQEGNWDNRWQEMERKSNSVSATSDTIYPETDTPRKDKIRALNKGIGEWGTRSVSTSTETVMQENLFLVMGSKDTSEKVDIRSPHMVSRFPWEGFDTVGFRTVLSAQTGQPESSVPQ